MAERIQHNSPNHIIKFYGTTWCPDSRRARDFLAQHNIPFEWIDIDQDPNARRFVIEANQGYRIIPTIVFPDGTILAEPTNQQLAKKLNIPE